MGDGWEGEGRRKGKDGGEGRDPQENSWLRACPTYCFDLLWHTKFLTRCGRTCSEEGSPESSEACRARRTKLVHEEAHRDVSRSP